MGNDGQPSVLERARQLVPEAEEEIDRLKAKKVAFLTEINVQIKELEAFVRSNTPRQQKPKPARTANHKPMQPTRLLEYAEAALQMPDDRFSPHMLADAMGQKSESGARYALDELRTHGLVIAAGTAYPNPDKPRGVPRQMYSVATGVADQVMAELVARSDAS